MNNSNPIDIQHLKLYNELASYYFALENVHRNFNQEISFLEKYLPHNSRKEIVDLGCGSGEHLARLSEEEYDVIGIDLSENMLAIARERYPDLRVIKDDMANLTIAGQFIAFFSLFGTLNYLLDDHSLKKTFRGIWQRLVSGGLFLLEVWNAEPIRLIRKKAMSNVSSIIYENRVIHRNRGFELLENGARTLVKVQYLYQIDDKELQDVHLMRAFFQQEILDLLEESGFANFSVFGSFDESKVEKQGSRIIILAYKADL